MNVQPPGTIFTFHKFLVVIQKLADLRHKGDTQVQKIAQFLHSMDKVKPFWSAVFSAVVRYRLGLL